MFTDTKGHAMVTLFASLFTDIQATLVWGWSAVAAVPAAVASLF